MWLLLCRCLDRLRSVQVMEKLHDEYQFFVLYYGNDIPKMKQALKAAKRRQKEQQRAAEGEDQEIDEDPADDDAEETSTLKHAPRKSGYMMCINAGLGSSTLFLH